MFIGNAESSQSLRFETEIPPQKVMQLLQNSYLTAKYQATLEYDLLATNWVGKMNCRADVLSTDWLQLLATCWQHVYIHSFDKLHCVRQWLQSLQGRLQLFGDKLLPNNHNFFFFFFCSIAIVQICVCILRWTLYREVLKHYKCASIKSFKIPIARCWTQMMLYMLWMLIGWQMNQSREETNSRNHQERKKFKKNQRLKRYQQGLLWTLCIVFNTRFHFSSLCVITLLSTQPPGKSNNEMSSSTQTSFTTYFMHSIHPQMFSPLISMDSQHATTSEPQFQH